MTGQSTVHDAVEARAALEKRVAAELNEFQNEFGLQVTYVYLENLDVIGPGQRALYRVRIEVSLP